MASSIQYRPDLDGLRAVAVTSVILYHLSHNILAGGYLGVDVFFVLSGYLITSIIWREAKERQFSIRRFYERRIRRIMPALLLVLFVTTIGAYLILLPADLIGYSRSLIATMMFVANIYFWRDTDYFARNAEFKPLLHTWSLGVEEQFYIFFPLLLVVLARFVPRLTIYIIGLLAVGSLALNMFVIHIGGSAPAFFLLPTRAWELGLGAVIALLPVTVQVHPKVASVLSWIGFACVIVGLITPIALTVNTPVAVPVVVGTTLMVLAGRGSQPMMNRVLSWRPIVFVGLISYSLYLWHWPVFVLSRYYFVNGLPAYAIVLELLLIVACATLSWRFVERPFRSRQMPVTTVVLSSGSGVLALAGAAAVMFFLNGLPSRLNAQAAVINAAIDTHYRCPVSQYISLGLNRACPMNLPSRNPRDADVVLLGNSHAQMYAPAWTDLFVKHGVPGLLVPFNGCLPTVIANYGKACNDTAIQNLQNVLALPHVRLVILAFTWTWPDPFTDASGRVLANAHDADLVTAIDDLIKRLKAAGKDVILVGPIARPGWDVASTVSRELAFGWPQDHEADEPIAQFNDQFGAAIAHFEADKDISFVPVHEVQCDDVKCAYFLKGQSLYSDDSHLAEQQLWRFKSMFESAYDKQN